jgi:phosphatidylserine/phosphatidylglycerophosphate/cardiolipin synthase-like enzyme
LVCSTKFREKTEQVGEEVYISMINKAEKYCWFMTPYLIITDEMTHALCLAAKRGVDVRIITPGIPDKKFIYILHLPTCSVFSKSLSCASNPFTASSKYTISVF